MVKTGLRSLAFFAALGITPVVVSPVVMHAQQVNEDQRAYQVGYQNGVNAARANRPMNMSTDDWHGDRVNFYQQGYQAGYNSVAEAASGTASMPRIRSVSAPIRLDTRTA